MLDFRIDTFLTVCRTRNLTKAAEQLNITQPAVTHHIHHLEEDYGVKLFTYTGKQLHLTPAGKRLLDAAATMKHDELHLRQELPLLAQRESGLLFGATLTIGEFVMPPILAAYMHRYPDRPVHMAVADTQAILQQLDDGAVDFALVEGHFDSGAYEALLFSSEPYVAVCAADHVFAAPPRQVRDLCAERLLLREAGSGTREVLVRHLADHNLSLHDFPDAVEISNIGAIKALVRRGCGVTFVYRAAVAEELAAGTLREIPLEDFRISHDFSFIWHKRSLYEARYRAVFACFQEAHTTGALG